MSPTTPTTQKHMSHTITNPKALAFITACNDKKGQFIELSFKSEPTPASAFKSVKLEKFTKGVYRTGINFANLAPVKEAIENKERGEVQPLAWGSWAVFPLVISHTNKAGEYKEYLRITFSPSHKPTVAYKVDGIEVSKEHFESHLRPSDRLPKPPTLVFNIEADNLLEVHGLDLTEAEVSGV